MAVLSGRWGLAAGLALAAAAVLLLTGGPGRPAWGSLGALGLGAAVVGGFWRSRTQAAAQAMEHAATSANTDGEAAADRPKSAVTTPKAAARPTEPPEPTIAASAATAQDAAEIARLETLLGDLPELGLMLDLQGRAEVVFGRPLAGVSAEALHVGLATLAAATDRPALASALAEAAAGGYAQAEFGLAHDASRRLRLSLGKTSEGSLAGILTEAPATPKQAATAAAPASSDRLWSPSTTVADAAAELAQARKATTEAEAARDAAVTENANKSRFLANMSHELRTPLNAILGFSDIMKTKLFGPLPERYAEYAELIHESGRHLTDLINDVLDMSKIEADRYVLHREDFDAREPIASALKLLTLQAEDKGVSLRGDLPAEAVEVDADRRALKQIVINLVANAIKFTPPEGRVDVILRPQGGALELVVADTGEGIAPEDLKRLGQPYAQTDAGRRAQGTGLGLSLVKALTALHGGEFVLESRLGEGSAATVRLPVLTPGAKARTSLV